jgi:hypothetical protein
VALATNRGMDTFVRGQMYRYVAGKRSTSGLDLYVRNVLFSSQVSPLIVVIAARRRRSRLAMPVRKNGLVVIAQNASESTAFDCQGLTAFGIMLPAALTGSQCTFKVSTDNVTYSDLYDSNGSLVTCTISVNTAITLATELLPWRFIKIVTSQNQVDARTIAIVASSG